MNKICVLGLGYIGLPTAGMFATHGYQVVGVDVNNQIINTLNGGDVHIQEPGLKMLIQAGVNSGTLHVCQKPEPADVFVIAVPTPLASGDYQLNDGSDLSINEPPKADLDFVISAAESIVPHLNPGNLVILESTVPPRTTLNILVPILEKSGIKVSTDSQSIEANLWKKESERLFVAQCPERVLPGRILEELVGNDRVVGGVCLKAAKLAKNLYASFVGGKIFTTDATTAELVKLMENTYRDINIALANEFALVADKVEVNIWDAIEMANRHPRVNILKPGPGVGGHCIAVDPWFIVEAASEVTPLIRAGRRVNDSMPSYVVKLIIEALSSAHDEKRLITKIVPSDGVVACLGLAYKADVDDIRESPALEVLRLLKNAGFEVRVFDPKIKKGVFQEQVGSIDSAVDGADVLVLLTDHGEFKNLEPTRIRNFKGKIIIDTRNLLSSKLWLESGYEIWYVGASRSKIMNGTRGVIPSLRSEEIGNEI